MRILHISDIHLGKKLQEQSRVADHADFFDQAIAIAKEQEVDLVIVAGDLYDSPNVSSQSRFLFHNFSKRVVQELGKKIIIIAGNHDSAANIEYQNDLLELSGYYAEGVLKKDIRVVTLQDAYGEIDFFLLPYAGPVTVRDTLGDPSIHSFNEAYHALAKRIKRRSGVRSVFIMHGLLMNDPKEPSPGVDQITGGVEDEQITWLIGQLESIQAGLFSDFDYVALGHIHRAYNVAPNIRYCGAPIPFTFQESKFEKSVTVVDLKEPGHVDQTVIPIKVKRNLIRKKGTFDALLKEGAEADMGEHFYELTLEEDTLVEHAADRLRNYYQNLVSLRYAREDAVAGVAKTNAIETDKMQPTEVIDAFYEYKRSEKMAPEERKLVEEMLRKSQEAAEEDR